MQTFSQKEKNSQKNVVSETFLWKKVFSEKICQKN